VLLSPEVEGLFSTSQFLKVDKDKKNQTVLAKYIQRATDPALHKSLPVLFLVSKAGAVLYEGPLPGDVTAMKALVNKHKGAK
jgi:hypothetical protein